jgi:hypothetical protein
MSNLLLVAMFLFFSVPSLIYKEYFLAMAFILFGLVFGFDEFLAHYATGHTVSQQIWDLEIIKKDIIIGFMLFGWCCLMIHFGVKVTSWWQMVWLLLKSAAWILFFMKFILGA